MIRPDAQGPSPSFDGGGSISGPWGITVDGNDHVWVANGFGKTLTELCGVRTDTCPPGLKTGDPISPPKTGYAGKGMQFLTGVAVDPAAAMTWYLSAAEAGVVRAQLIVARRYQDGNGVPADDAAALGWLKRAADANNAEAQYLVGVAYLEGRGTGVSIADALAAFQLSSGRSI